MTLIELLVVIVILTTIVGAAIPILSPANDDRRLREAARGVDTFITGAQSRAIANRRPYGIILKRLSQDTQRPEDRGACLEMFYAEQPAPYAGFDANSRVCVALNPSVPGQVLVRYVTRGGQAATLPPGWDADLFPSGMIRPGDVVEVAGTRLLLQKPASGDQFSNIELVEIDPEVGNRLEFFNPRNGVAIIPAVPLNDSGQRWAPSHDNNGLAINEIAQSGQPGQAPYWSEAAPYKILRQPTAASDQPYQLPEGAAIDLRASGLGESDFFYWPTAHDNTDPVTIMFSPEGKVSRLRFNQAYQTDTDRNASVPFDQPVSDNLYLLVGKRENIPAPIPDDSLDAAKVSAATTDPQRAKLREKLNWLRSESRWVVIGALSGRIVTVENAFVPLEAPLSAQTDPEMKRREQILAAREFTRDMRQLGGR